MANTENSARGVITAASQHSVDDTLQRLETALTERGITIFARIDFAADAARHGLKMPAERLVIFGNPVAGTPLMQAQPEVGLDLPLKILIWEDASGKTWLAYNDPRYLIQRHGLDAHFVSNIAAAAALVRVAGTG